MSKNNQIEIDVWESAPRKVMYFNTFSVSRREKDFLILDFAFVYGSDVVDQYTCAILISDAETQKDSFLRFIRELPKKVEFDIPAHPSFGRPRGVEVADIIGMARHEGVGEIALFAFSWKKLVDGVRKEKGITSASFVALLRCNASLLRKFIVALYE